MCVCVCVGGGILVGFERGGACQKIWPQRGVTGNKMLGVKGGGEVTKKILSSFAVTPSVIMQTTYQNTKYQHF